MPAEISEIEGVDRFLDSLLNSDAALLTLVTKFYREQAPQKTARPYGIYQLQTAPDRNMPGTVRVFTRPQYLIKVVGEGDDLRPLMQAMAEVDRILRPRRHARQGPIRIEGIHRVQTVRYIENPSGLRLNHYGFIYQIFAYSTAD